MSPPGQRPIVPPIISEIDDRFVTPTEVGQLTDSVTADQDITKSLPESFDIRRPNAPLEPQRPYGSGFGVDVTEILRRGFKALTVDEQANVIGAYLATQKQQLAVFESADQTYEKTERLKMDKDAYRVRRILSIIAFATIILVAAGVISLIIYFASKGVLSDSSLFQGLFTLLQEVFRVITSGGKY